MSANLGILNGLATGRETVGGIYDGVRRLTGGANVVDVQVFTSSSNTSLSGGWYHDGSGMFGTNDASNMLFRNDRAAHRPTGDLEIIFYGKAEVWSNRLMALIVSGRTNSPGNYSYRLGTTTAGQFVFDRPTSAGVGRTYTSAAHNLADNAAKWVKVEWDQDNGAGQSETKFYLSDDGATWTQLGTAVTNASAAAGQAGLGGLRLGAEYSSNSNGQNPFRGWMYRWIVKDGIGGTTVFDVDVENSAPNTRRWQEFNDQVYLVSTSRWFGTWTKPGNAEMVRVLCVGAGSGGSGGSKGAAGTDRAGGVSGMGGAASIAEFEATALPSTLTVTVGKGGLGGPRVTNNTSVGGTVAIAPTDGEASAFGTLVTARPGTFGGGTSSNPSGLFSGVTRQGSTSVAPIQPIATFYSAGGGAGGGISAANVVSNGGPGGAPLVSNFAGVLSLGAGGRCGNASDTGDGEDGVAGSHGCGGGGGGAAVNGVGNGGAGGDGGDALVVVVSYSNTNLQAFTSSGTWVKPSGDYKIARVFVVGGGGGGASGPTGTPTTGTNPASGGGAGGSSGVTVADLDFASLPSTVNVTVGAGGVGGAGVTGTNVARNGGNNGGQSLFLKLSAIGGFGGLTTNSTGGNAGVGGSFVGVVGQGGGSAAGSTGGSGGYNAAGGGGSGTTTTGEGGAGGLPFAHATMPGTGTGPNTGNAPSGQLVASGHGIFGGTGGAGGGGANGGVGKNGGNGSPRGSGGGGGGRAVNTFTSGSGGNGGDGYVCVICY